MLAGAPDQSGQKSLLAEITSALDSTKTCQEHISALANYDEAEAAAAQQQSMDSQSLFAELDGLLRKGETEVRGAATKITPVQQDVKMLLAKVANDSQLLAKMYPVHDPAAEEPDPAKAASPPPRKARPEDEEKAVLFRELDALLGEAPTEHQARGMTHAQSMAQLLDEHQSKHRDTAKTAQALLLGDMGDEMSNPAHRAHTDWQKSTLMMMQTTRKGAGFGDGGRGSGGHGGPRRSHSAVHLGGRRGPPKGRPGMPKIRART